MKNVRIVSVFLFFSLCFFSSAAAAVDLQTQYVMKGDAYFNNGSFVQAKDAYVSAVPIFQGIKKDPNPYAKLWYQIGLCDMNLGDYDKALTNFDSALHYVTDPELKNKVLREKAKAYLYLRRFSEAEIMYTNAGMSTDDAKNAVNEYKKLHETTPEPALIPERTAVTTTLPREEERNWTTAATTITPAVTGSADQRSPASLPAEIIIGIGLAAMFCVIGVIYFRRIRPSGKIAGEEPDPGRIPGSPGRGQGRSGEIKEPKTEEDTLPSPERPVHHEVFICYSHRDKPVSDAICAHLEGEGIRCWMAPRDVSPGENFPDAIIRAIEQSRLMVLVFSSDSNNSPHVIRELTKAVSCGLVIIPFRIEDAPLSRSMEYLIGLPHWLDAITPPLMEHIKELSQSVHRFLDGKNE